MPFSRVFHDEQAKAERRVNRKKMKTAIIMIALLVSTFFAFPVISAQTDALDSVPSRISDLKHKNPDLDGDGDVDGDDRDRLLKAWGLCSTSACSADLDNSGIVGASDLLILLANWSDVSERARLLASAPKVVPKVASSITGTGRSSVTITDVRKASGIDITDSDLVEFGLNGKDTSLVIVISGYGPEVKFILFEIKTALISKNGEKTLHTDRVYKGKLSIESGTFNVGGTNLRGLEIIGVGNSQPKTIPISITSTIDGESHTVTVNAAVNKLADKSEVKVGEPYTVNGVAIRAIEIDSDLTTSNSDSNKVVGKADFDFANRVIHLTVNGETKSYELTSIERRPVREDTAPGRIVSDIVKEDTDEKVPFWKRWRPFQSESDRTSDTDDRRLIASSAERISEQNEVSEKTRTDVNKGFWKSFFDRFRNR